MGVIALLIILIGLFPHYIMGALIEPALSQTTYDPMFINNYITGVNFFAFKDLITMLFVVIGGFIIFILGTKYHLFHLKLPKWLSLEYMLFYPLNKTMQKTCEAIYGEACPISPEEMEKMKLKTEEDAGVLKRFMMMANTVNKRYETKIITSDAAIYGFTLFVLLIVFLIYALF